MPQSGDEEASTALTTGSDTQGDADKPQCAAPCLATLKLKSYATLSNTSQMFKPQYTTAMG